MKHRSIWEKTRVMRICMQVDMVWHKQHNSEQWPKSTRRGNVNSLHYVAKQLIHLLHFTIQIQFMPLHLHLFLADMHSQRSIEVRFQTLLIRSWFIVLVL
jgi:hypothetical protein